MATKVQKFDIHPELIAVGDPQKIEVDLKPFNKAKEQVSLTINELNRFIKISSKEAFDEAQAVLKIASKVEKAIENKRKELVEPFNGGAKAINNFAKEITEGLPSVIKQVKDAVLAFQKEEEEKAAKLIREARIKQLAEMGFTYNEQTNLFEQGDLKTPKHNLDLGDINWKILIEGLVASLELQEAKKLQEDDDLLDILGETSDTIAAIAPAKTEALPAPSTAFFAPAKLSGAAKVWKFEITDAASVPREYLIVDETAIRRAVNSGKREIPGVRIYQEDQLRIR